MVFSHGKSWKIHGKLNFLGCGNPVSEKLSVPRISLIFYMMRIRIFHLHDKKEKGMSPFYFFQKSALK